MTGFININKETGVSSAFVVNKVKRLSGMPAGHMGTLDPLASGVLPVALGNACRLFDYFSDKKKTYLARFRFGVTTETLDSEGEKIVKGGVPSEKEIQNALVLLTGKIMQVPPVYSAKSVNGVRSYQLARAGKEVELKAKQVEIFDFRLSEQTAEDEFAFEIVCSSGTYIRALARDLAEQLNTYAYLSALSRTASGICKIEDAVSLTELTKENIANYLIPTENVLPYPALNLESERVFNGLKERVESGDGLYKLYRKGEFYGIASVEGGLAKAEKKLC